MFVETSMPVVKAFEEQEKVVSVEATGGVDDVYGRIREGFEKKGVLPL